jgi:hypothetical protein
MILYDPRQHHGLMDFGIEIPVMDSRASETFARLSSHPYLVARREAWHIHALQGPVEREDLLRVNSADYVGRLFSAGLEAEIIRTFELIAADGNYHRYQPALATRYKATRGWCLACPSSSGLPRYPRRCAVGVPRSLVPRTCYPA